MIDKSPTPWLPQGEGLLLLTRKRDVRGGWRKMEERVE
jgi:hypothetical protein